jgi:hypothetical protein
MPSTRATTVADHVDVVVDCLLTMLSLLAGLSLMS